MYIQFVNKNQGGFTHWLILVTILAILASIGFYVGHTLSTRNTEYWNSPSAQNKLAACGTNSQLSVMPFDSSKTDSIGPLGNVNPPGHVWPSDHIGISLKHISDADQKTLESPVYAPGDVHIIGAEDDEFYTNGRLTENDWKIAFTPCRELTFYYGHVQHLSGGLASIVASLKKSCGGMKQNADGTTNRGCTYMLDYNAKAGEQIGRAGGTDNVQGIDFGAWDMRIPRLPFIDQKYVENQGSGKTYYSVCALNYYREPIRNELFSLIKNHVGCLTNMEDKLGTIQGNWLRKGARPEGYRQQDQFAIVHDTVDLGVGVVSSGGTVTAQDGSFGFYTKHLGLVNREPSEVTSDGNTYCYQANQTDSRENRLDGKILIKLIDNQTMLAQSLTGSCTDHESLTNPTTYVR